MCRPVSTTTTSASNPQQQSTLSHGPTCGCGKCGGKPIHERHLASAASPANTNRGVIFMGPNHVEVKGIPFPELALDSTASPVESERQKRSCQHGAILKIVTTNICGSDQHMVRGRTSLPGGHMVLGHEITGEVIETGRDVEFCKVGDICSVPFNIACGRCAACKRGDTGLCLQVNPARAGAAYGYVDMGGWIGECGKISGDNIVWLILPSSLCFFFVLSYTYQQVDKPSMLWSPTPTLIYSNFLIEIRQWKRFAT